MKKEGENVADDIFRTLQQKCDKVGIGFPPTAEGYELNYLRELFTPEEAEFYVKMDDGYQTVEEVAKSRNEEAAVTDRKLQSMASRGLLFRVHDGDTIKYRTLPVIHGFYEFAILRLNKVIARNFSKHFMNGMGANFFKFDDPFFRVLPINVDIVSNKKVLPIDDAIAIIKRQDRIAVANCFCRLVNKFGPKGGCNNPLETCLCFNTFCDYYLENGAARKITQEEAIEIITRSNAIGLAIEVSNSEAVEVMCSCCSCCCGVMNATKLFRGPANDQMSNYLCRKDEPNCIQCGICVERCPVNAQTWEGEQVVYHPELCIGCGLCVTTCPTQCLSLLMKDEEKIYLPPAPTLMDTYDYITEKRKKAEGY